MIFTVETCFVVINDFIGLGNLVQRSRFAQQACCTVVRGENEVLTFRLLPIIGFLSVTRPGDTFRSDRMTVIRRPKVRASCLCTNLFANLR